MNIDEMRAATAEGRAKELDALLRQQFNLRLQKVTGQLAAHTQLSKVRREIARLRTVVTEAAGTKA